MKGYITKSSKHVFRFPHMHLLKLCSIAKEISAVSDSVRHSIVDVSKTSCSSVVLLHRTWNGSSKSYIKIRKYINLSKLDMCINTRSCFSFLPKVSRWRKHFTSLSALAKGLANNSNLTCINCWFYTYNQEILETIVTATVLYLDLNNTHLPNNYCLQNYYWSLWWAKTIEWCKCRQIVT